MITLLHAVLFISRAALIQIGNTMEKRWGRCDEVAFRSMAPSCAEVLLVKYKLRSGANLSEKYVMCILKRTDTITDTFSRDENELAAIYMYRGCLSNCCASKFLSLLK